jgi:transketolase
VSADPAELRRTARLLRRDVVEMVYRSKDGHPGGALSSADIVTALYFSAMRVDPANPRWPDRDRFILSKGHSCPVLYAALARRGFFSPDILTTLRRLGSPLQGHPDMNKTPGIDMTSGSLGHGISIGTGMAAAARLTGRDYRVYVIVGDGELNEGLVWESAMSAVHQKAHNLTVFVDHNGLQSDGTVRDVSGIGNIAGRFASFGWNTLSIDGHDMAAILAAIEAARAETERPTLIVAATVKGKGVPFMENNGAWHKKVPTDGEYKEAMEALRDPA